MTDSVLTVLRGEPAPDELAALIVALAVTTRRPDQPDGDVPAAWTRPARYVPPGSWLRPTTAIWARGRL